MPKTTGLPPALNLTAARNHDGKSPLSPALRGQRAADSPMTPTSMPGSPIPQNTKHHMGTGGDGYGVRALNSPVSPRVTAMPDFPPSPDRAGSKHGRDASKSFFQNFKASKSTQKLATPEQVMADASDKANSRGRASSKDRALYDMRKQASTHDLPRMLASSRSPNEGYEEVGEAPGSVASSDATSNGYKKSKSKLGGLLNRTRTMKIEDDKSRPTKPPAGLSVDTHALANGAGDSDNTPLKTAPLKSDYRERAFASEVGSANRTRSADRHATNEASSKKQPSAVSSSLPKEHSLLANIQHTGRGVGDRLGKAGKGFFSKISRSGSSTEREVPTEENYVCSTINLPLVQQTRKTRIAKRLELSRDKTEFWMPALPWRCIDYLNMNGCEEEGLYRIPGSGREVKMWQKRFDTEYDINLFEEPELYDINTIGSMFKSWLRGLPDDILPKAVQNKIAHECAGATTTPQLLKDELSKLPPFNYYLLFAITCHLSLLHSFAEKNKMDYRNLCICFQPCLKIDTFCFQFLVINWKECWQGCWTEHEYLQEEYRWEKEGSIRSGSDHSLDDRAISSSGSSRIFPQPPPKSADPGIQRKGSMPQLSKKRSMSSGAQGARGHGNSSSLPSVPQVSQTPEQRGAPDQQLPELQGLSPIRM